jgi:hypothetical protein
MVRVWILLLSSCLLGHSVHAQAKLQPLIKRIALLQVYLGYVKKGYRVVQGGLRFIGDVKKGEFSLHTDYLGSWGEVNPGIRKGQLTLACIQLQQQLIRRCYAFSRQAQASIMLADKEAVQQTIGVVLQEVELGVSMLGNWIEATQLKATDEDRLSALHQLYQQLMELSQFLDTYQTDWQLLQIQRQRALQAIQSTRAYHSIK